MFTEVKKLHAKVATSYSEWSTFCTLCTTSVTEQLKFVVFINSVCHGICKNQEFAKFRTCHNLNFLVLNTLLSTVCSSICSLQHCVYQVCYNCFFLYFSNISEFGFSEKQLKILMLTSCYAQKHSTYILRYMLPYVNIERGSHN